MAALFAVWPACGGNEDQPGAGSSARFPESEASTVVRATLRDFAFEGVPPTVGGPKVYFEAANRGPTEHELVVEDDAGKELGEIEAFDKGKDATPLAIELKPGRYKLTCLVKLGDKTHTDLGMEASFTVE